MRSGVVYKEDRAFCPLPTRRGPVLGGYTAAVIRAAERFRGNAPFLRVGGQSSGAIRRRLSARPNAAGEMPPSSAWGASPRGLSGHGIRAAERFRGNAPGLRSGGP